MSETKKELPTSIEGIKVDSIINIDVSGGVYSRLRQLLLHHSQTKSPAEFAEALQKVKDNKADDVYSYHVETLMVLILGLEEAAKNQGKIDTADLIQKP